MRVGSRNDYGNDIRQISLVAPSGESPAQYDADVDHGLAVLRPLPLPIKVTPMVGALELVLSRPDTVVPL